MSADAAPGPEPPEPPLLNWRDSRHWSDFEAPCIHCYQPTNLRDDKRRASHKTCAEKALARQAAKAAATYQEGAF
jgi:hypothetical protein